MNSIKIFLASSSDLVSDRDQFEIFVQRENERLVNNELFLKVIRWENFVDAMSREGLQKEYNKAAVGADIFIMLYSTKVGKYTAEEFDAVYNKFEQTGYPLIYIFSKEVLILSSMWEDVDYESFNAFNKKMKGLKHYRTSYTSTEAFLHHFKNQLDKLLEDQNFQSRIKNKENLEKEKPKVTVDEEITNPIVNHNLPSRTYGSKLVGRVDDIKRVLNDIKEYPVVTIVGFSGIGKTSVALEIGHIFLNKSEVENDTKLIFNYVVWFSAKNLEHTHWLNEVLNKIGEVLNHPSIAQKSYENLRDKKMEVEKLLGSRLYKILLIIDNFETINDEELLNWLQILPEPNKVLITSQRIDSETHISNLKRLSNEEALALIRKYAEAKDLRHLITEPDEKLLSLVTITGGNPLAIRLSIGSISGGILSLTQVIKSLTNNNATESLEIVFQKIHETSWMGIGEKGRRLLLITPFFIGIDSVDKQALQSASGLSKSDFNSAIETLLKWKLLEPNFDDINRYVIHSITRRFVKTKLSEDVEFEKLARKRWSQHYVKFIEDNIIRTRPNVPYWNVLVNDKMDLIDLEWISINEVIKWACSGEEEEKDELLLKLVLLSVHYMDSRFYNLERITYVEKAVKSASRLCRRYEEALLRIDALGWTYVEENHFEKAYTMIMEGIALAKLESASTQAGGELIALGHAWAARVRIEQDQPELVIDAEELINIALQFDDKSKPWIRFRILMAAGDIAFKQKNNQEALHYYQQAKEKMKDYDGEGHYYQINPRIGLANFALGLINQAELIFTDLASQQNISIGKLYGDYGLALIEFDKGNADEANLRLTKVKDELSKRTSSNLLLKLITEFEKTLKRDTTKNKIL